MRFFSHLGEGQMLSRLGKVFMVTLPLAVTGMPGGIAVPEECGAATVCGEAEDWVCCNNSDECDEFMIAYCNRVDGGDPFDQECGWN
jgi:hypothetical protein